MKKYDLKHFDAVWARVTSSSEDVPSAPPSGETDRALAMLRKFIAEEAENAQVYRALAAKCRNVEVRRLYLSLAEQEKRHLKKLQMQHYLKTGNSFPIRTAHHASPSPLAALQQRYAAELQTADAYRAEAEKTGDAALRGTYAVLSKEEEKHAQRLHVLVRRVIS